MLGLSTLDLAALAVFAGAWAAYAITIEWTRLGRKGLNALANRYRRVWMERLLERDMRMVDTQLLASLHNGTAFFASTSLIAIGGSLTILRSADDLVGVAASLPFATPTTRLLWEIKVIGLAVILVYAFFKFAWSYRLFNYVAILIGAMPPAEEKDTAEAAAHVERTTRLFESAGRHFNRGQRAFFMALGYLGWFVGPWVLMASTAAIVAVMWHRQFASDSRAAVIGKTRWSSWPRKERG